MSANQAAALGAGTSVGILPAGLINNESAAAVFNPVAANGLTGMPLAVVSSVGAVTAAALNTVLSLAGRGCLSFAAVSSANTTSRTNRLKITADGVVVFDKTTAATASVANVYCAVGSVIYTGSASAVLPEPLIFNTSLLIEYASSNTEATSGLVGYRFIPR